MYVKNLNHFLEHTRSHIENVQYIANHLVDEIKENKSYRLAFNVPLGADLELFREKMLEGMKYHDAAKICDERFSAEEIGDSLMGQITLSRELEAKRKGDVTFSRANSHEQGASMGVVLYQAYGSGLHEMPNHAREQFFQVVNNLLNEKDQKIMENYLNETFSKPWEKELFRTIEAVADKVDRGLNPISKEEFGREMTPASEFMKKELPEDSTLKETKLIKLTEKAEEWYSERLNNGSRVASPCRFYNQRQEEIKKEPSHEIDFPSDVSVSSIIRGEYKGGVVMRPHEKSENQIDFSGIKKR